MASGSRAEEGGVLGIAAISEGGGHRGFFHANTARARIPAACVLAVSAAYALIVCWGQYARGDYGWHDLGMIASWYDGIPFWIGPEHRSHLGIHWTPTLILYWPVVRLFGPFAICALGVICIHLGAWFQVLILERWCDDRVVLACAALVFADGLFARTVECSAHYEPPFVLLASVWLWAVSEERKLVGWIAFLLALGVREDAGLVLALLSVAILVVWRFGILWAPMGLLHTVIATRLMLLFGHPFTAPWAKYGATQGSAVLGMLRHPAWVLSDIASSGALHIPILALLSPAGWAGALAGLPMMLADETSRHGLWYYCSAMMLPGLWLGMSCGVRWFKGSRWWAIAWCAATLWGFHDLLDNGLRFMPWP